MRPLWPNLNELDRAAFRATMAFLNGRLEERATFNWALHLKPNDTIKRLAVVDLIDSSYGGKIREPWRSAWRLIEESWNNPAAEEHASTNIYALQHRLRAGELSGALVAAIVELVAPRLQIEPFSDSHPIFRNPPTRPKKIEDLFSTRLTSGKIVDPATLKLEGLSDRFFLTSLAHALDSSVFNGLNIARRIGWDGEHRIGRLGQLHRVYYVPTAERTDEPDRFHRGIAPSVKLLHAVVSRLVDVDSSSASEFVRRWRFTNSPIHLRLWAALSKNSRITPSSEIGTWLLSLDDRRFWNLHEYPEITELRAMRFGELETDKQEMITTRIRKRPPRNQWPRKADFDRVGNARIYWAVRELRRFEIAGTQLPNRDKEWMDSKIQEFPDLLQMTRLDDGFLESPKASYVPPRPDSRFDSLTGEERLKALETALSSARGGWDEGPAGGAADWIKKLGNPSQVLIDFESIPDRGASFARVWERFGWAHSSAAGLGLDTAEHDLPAECMRVLSLIANMPEMIVRDAIAGISEWLSAWKEHVVVVPEGINVWLKLWPIAVEATNAEQPVEEKIQLNTVVQSSHDSEPMDLDTLNTPAGKLVGVFLAACPNNIQENDRPFDVDSAPRRMRDAIIASTGRSRLIALHRMIEQLPYFLRADPDWTLQHLITPLTTDDSETIALWSAIARQTHFANVLEIIGTAMIKRAIEPGLSRETRQSLVFSLVIECLHAFREQREPVVPYARIQQMIRALDDEVRAYGAEAIQRFVREVSAPRDGEPPSPSPEELFRSVTAPFLKQVWPQEHSLTTPGISRALAELPAIVEEAFAEAVDVIERFLIPFECWSMFEYGFGDEQNGKPLLSAIDNQEKAAAFLRLLDATIGTSEGSVIPHDLADALDQIRKVAPKLSENQVFRRLATAARRG
jgi:hypothetical protein